MSNTFGGMGATGAVGEMVVLLLLLRVVWGREGVQWAEGRGRQRVGGRGRACLTGVLWVWVWVWVWLWVWVWVWVWAWVCGYG